MHNEDRNSHARFLNLAKLGACKDDSKDQKRPNVAARRQDSPARGKRRRHYGFAMKAAIPAAFVAAIIAGMPPAIAQLDRISNREAVVGLKAALEKGAQAAVAALGRTDGFFGNPQVRIPLPESLERTERLMRRVGLGKNADELVLALNRAAEAAVPEARKLLVDAVKKMTFDDAKGILRGGETSATEYFRRSTGGELRKRFLPIVERTTARVNLAQKYDEYAAHGVALGLVKKEHADLDEYVTQKALDGLFFMVGEEEKKIRRDPVKSASSIIRRVFGAVR